MGLRRTGLATGSRVPHRAGSTSCPLHAAQRSMACPLPTWAQARGMPRPGNGPGPTGSRSCAGPAAMPSRKLMEALPAQTQGSGTHVCVSQRAAVLLLPGHLGDLGRAVVLVLPGHLGDLGRAVAPSREAPAPLFPDGRSCPLLLLAPPLRGPLSLLTPGPGLTVTCLGFYSAASRCGGCRCPPEVLCWRPNAERTVHGIWSWGLGK